MLDLVEQQTEICRKFSAQYEAFDLDLMVGVSKNFISGALPLNGLRHPQEGHSCGWFLWAGEDFSEAGDFWEVWHANHLLDRCPEIVKYLGLAPGWRFLVAGDYEDVWFDEKLLEV